MSEIAVTSPIGREILATYQPTSFEEILEFKIKAFHAHEKWKLVPMSDRIIFFQKLRKELIQNKESIVESICLITGKVPTEAFMTELLPTLEMISHLIKEGPNYLSPIKIKKSMSFPRATGYYRFIPYGVVAVISPWNFPFQLSMIPTISALLAGNAVLLKPSELSLPIAHLIQNLFVKAGCPDNLFIPIVGDGKTGEHLIKAQPNKIFFTGSQKTGAAIMAQAAQHTIPVTLELGGKDPMIVFEDAHFDRAVKGALYGAFCNSGQVCVSIERLYVQQPIYDRFCRAVAEEAKKLNVGSSVDDDMGAMTSPQQIEIIKAHVKDAEEKGGQFLTPWKAEGSFLSPLVIKEATPDMRVMREETFGPILPIMPFQTEEEAIALANDSIYGLNASVWTQDLKKGQRVAESIQTGNVSVNDVLKNIGHPALPFGGIKRSGFGRYHGAQGLQTFSQTQSILINDGKYKTEINWFPYGRELYHHLKKFVEFLYSNDAMISKIFRYKDTLKYFRTFFK